MMADDALVNDAPPSTLDDDNFHVATQLGPARGGSLDKNDAMLLAYSHPHSRLPSQEFSVHLLHLRPSLVFRQK
jgi:hypothetical protein